MGKYEKTTIEELDKLNSVFAKEVASTMREKRLVVAELERRNAEIKVKATIEGMTDSEKAALSQVLSGAGGIGSEEKVGTPGA